MRNSCNDNYFDIIDTEDKAYFLGFLYADGCVRKNKISIDLQERDIEVLNNFKKSIKYDGKILFKKSKNINHQDVVRISVSSKRMSDSLKNIGCVERKSLILKFPFDKISDHLINHFIRGYFDGDGTVHVNKISNQIIINMVGTIDFCNGINITLNRLTTIPLYKITLDKRTKNFGAYQCMGTNKVKLFYDFLYKI